MLKKRQIRVLYEQFFDSVGLVLSRTFSDSLNWIQRRLAEAAISKTSCYDVIAKRSHDNPQNAARHG